MVTLPSSVWLCQPRAKSDATLRPHLLTLATSVGDYFVIPNRPYRYICLIEGADAMNRVPTKFTALVGDYFVIPILPYNPIYRNDNADAMNRRPYLFAALVDDCCE